MFITYIIYLSIYISIYIYYDAHYDVIKPTIPDHLPSRGPGCNQALKPMEIIFPGHDLTSWRRGDQRSAAKQISVDKYVSHEIWRNMKKYEEMARKWHEKLCAN